MTWVTQVLIASVCFAGVQCSLQDIIGHGVTGVDHIGSGMGHLGSMFIPGLSDFVNQKPGGAGAGDVVGMGTGGIGPGQYGAATGPEGTGDTMGQAMWPQNDPTRDYDQTLKAAEALAKAMSEST